MADPAWLAQLRPAEFRGVPFKFSRVRKPGAGRRIVVHEYTDVDMPDTEDLGGKPRRYHVEGWVIGPDYFADRDALEAALDLPGPGILVHPYKGQMAVVVEDYDIEETTDEGGMARFSMVFLAASPPSQPAALIDTPAQVAAGAAIVKSFQVPLLARRFNVLSFFDVSEAVAQLTDLLRPLGQLSAQVRAVIQDPAALMGLIQGLLDPITDFGGLSQFFTAATNSAASSSTSQGNRAALTTAVQLQAIVDACTLSAVTAYDSANAALARRDQLLDAIDGVQGAVDDDTFAALQDLRAAVAQDIDTRAANLAVITSITLADTLPALALANRLYGPANAEAAAADIVARNGVLHPGFLPSGVPLEVLSDWGAA